MTTPLSGSPLNGGKEEVGTPSQGSGEPKTALGDGEPAFAPLATILLIDEEDYIRELVVAILSMEGYEVLDGNGPREAMEHVNYGGKIDLILCEAIFSGGVLGADLVNEIRKIHPDADALITTGFPDEAYDSKGIRTLRRPFTPKALKKEIETILQAREVSRHG